MTKREQVIISIGAIIGGWIVCGFAIVSTLGQVISNICIVVGLIFSVIGFISLILALKKPM